MRAGWGPEAGVGCRRIEGSVAMRSAGRVGVLPPARRRIPESVGEAGAFEKRPDSGLLPLHRTQTIFQSMLAGEQAIPRPVPAREQESGEGDAGGDDGDELRGQRLHGSILAKRSWPG